MKKTATFLLLSAGLGFATFADEPGATATTPARMDFQLPESIEMPSGEIYNHPKVVEVRPDGIGIMHDNGVAFWRFSQLPEAIQKKFRYDPVAAQKYTDELLLRRRHLDEIKMKKQIADADKAVYYDLVRMRYHCTELRMKIDATQRQIKWDKEKTARLNKDIDQDRQVIADGEKASAAPQPADEWGNTSPSDAPARMHIIGKFEDDWKQGKTDYDMWTSAAHGQEENLSEYIQEYQEAQAQVKTLEKKWADIQARQKNDSAQIDKEIHDTVKKNMDDSLQKMRQLREMRDNKLITQEEYINKKAELLKRM